MQILQFLFTGRLAKACKNIWAWATKQAHHSHKPTTAPKLTMRVMDNRDKSLKRQAKNKQTNQKKGDDQRGFWGDKPMRASIPAHQKSRKNSKQAGHPVSHPVI